MLLHFLLGILLCGSIAAQNFIEISVFGDTLLALDKATLNVNVFDQYPLPEGIAPEDIDNMNAGLRRKNTEQFERFLVSKKMAFKINKANRFSPNVLDADLTKSYSFICHSTEELEDLILMFRKLGYLSGGVGEVVYRNQEMMKQSLWARLFESAKREAQFRAKAAQGQLGKLLESSDQTELERHEMLPNPSNQGFGKLKMTARFRFELL